MVGVDDVRICKYVKKMVIGRNIWKTDLLGDSDVSVNESVA